MVLLQNGTGRVGIPSMRDLFSYLGGIREISGGGPRSDRTVHGKVLVGSVRAVRFPNRSSLRP